MNASTKESVACHGASRIQFPTNNMRRPLVTMPWWLIAAIAVSPALAAAVVYPTGTFPADVQNVQAGINQGGTILLKATDIGGAAKAFNFGPPVAGSGFVFQSNPDVTLLGETFKGQMTTITGGNVPIRVAFRSGRFTLRGIHLDTPRSIGVAITASGHAEIVSNVINDVVGSPSGGFTFGRGILVANDNVTGDLLIADNVINRVHAQVGYGISASFYRATTTISGNTILGINLNGILLGGIVSPATIGGNLVIPGPAQDADVTAGNGILFGHSRGGPAWIANNTVVCENPLADGIAVVGGGAAPFPANDSVVEKNDVTMHASLFGGVSLYDQVANNLVRANKIAGDGAFALQAAAFIPGSLADSNSFVGNNIFHFNSNTADVFLDVNSANTIFKGQSGTVIDLGAGNWVSGFTMKSMDQSLGQRMRQAQAVRRQAMAIDRGDPEI